MYPNLGFFAEQVFGLKIPLLHYAQTFGFFVAMGFLVGAFFMQKELKRKADEGLILPQIKVDPKTGKKTSMYPHQRVADIIFVAAIAGFIGAKLFNAMETWDSFIADPIGSLFSRSGLTFYGGLILATAALYVFAKKINLNFKHLCDAAAPALILAYGIGRLGCHFSGDGDWGIYNSAYITTFDGQVAAAGPGQFDSVVQLHGPIMDHFEGKIPHTNYVAEGIPRWLVAMNYAHNVNNDGVPINGVQQEYNFALPVSVFPTSIWEFAACALIIFPILWGVRRKLKRPLQLFGVYLIFNGLERFFVEKIRVNTKIEWMGSLQPTQAEFISSCLIIAGLILLIYNSKSDKTLGKA